MSQDAIGVLDVARDLVELGRDDEARALLDAELPNRLDAECPACGAHGRYWWILDERRDRGPGTAANCHERGLVTCRFCSGSGKRTAFKLVVRDALFESRKPEIVRCYDCHGAGKREQDVDMIVPHESRLAAVARRKAGQS